MLKQAYYMAGRNIMSENSDEAKTIVGNRRIQAALNSSKRDLRRELDGAGLTRNRISKREFADRATSKDPNHQDKRFGHFDGRMMRRMGKQNYNNMVKQEANNMNYNNMVKSAYEDIMDFDKEASQGPMPLTQGEINRMRRRDREDTINRAVNTVSSIAKAGKKGYFRGAGSLGGAGSIVKNSVNQVGTPSTGVAGSIVKNSVNQVGTPSTGVAGSIAEKAAAYYDEAQLIKEAAEADYAEACAYADAALAILDELGYLD